MNNEDNVQGMLEDALGALEQEVPTGPGSEVVSEEL